MTLFELAALVLVTGAGWLGGWLCSRLFGTFGLALGFVGTVTAITVAVQLLMYAPQRRNPDAEPFSTFSLMKNSAMYVLATSIVFLAEQLGFRVGGIAGAVLGVVFSPILIFVLFEAIAVVRRRITSKKRGTIDQKEPSEL